MITNDKQVAGKRRCIPGLLEHALDFALNFEALFGGFTENDPPIFRLNQQLIAAHHDMAVSESSGMLPASLAGLEVDRCENSFVKPHCHVADADRRRVLQLQVLVSPKLLRREYVAVAFDDERYAAGVVSCR